MHGIYKFSRNSYVFGFIIINLEISIIQTQLRFTIYSFIYFIKIHFQIIPEESAMPDLFKDDFLKYKENVRRWI